MLARSAAMRRPSGRRQCVTLYVSDALAQQLGSDPKWWHGAETGTSRLQV